MKNQGSGVKKRRFQAHLFFSILVLGLFVGCASNTESQPPNPAPQTESSLGPVFIPDFNPECDRGNVVFIRPQKFYAAARTASLFDITDGAKFLGNLPNSTKIVAFIEPGTRLFMATIAGGRGVMQAEIERGKLYYVLVTAGLGPVTAEGQMTSLQPDIQGDKIIEYRASTREVFITDDDIAWDRNNRPSIETHAIRAQKIWDNWDKAKKAKFSIKPGVGIEVCDTESQNVRVKRNSSLTGEYQSELKGDTNYGWFPWFVHGRPKTGVQLTQQGNVITGRFLASFTSSIKGTLENNEIIFEFTTDRCSTGHGKWKVSGSSLHGRWTCKDGPVSGNWTMWKR